ncbi:unnamed protein product [Ascophyllum nodosum]
MTAKVSMQSTRGLAFNHSDTQDPSRIARLNNTMWKFLKTAGVALVFVAARSFGEEAAGHDTVQIPEEDGVLVLDASNFDDAVAQNPTLLVEFYAPWCGHCKKLAPAYAKAAGTLAKDNLKIAKVDADAHKELGKKYGVSGFPTLKLVKEGKVSDYTGGRTADDIVAYVKKKSGPAAETLETVEDVKAFQGKQDAVVIGLFKSVDSDAAKAYMSAAGGIDRLAFGISSSDEVLKEYDASSSNKVVVLKTFDEKQAVQNVSDSTTAEEIDDFVQTMSMRLVTTFSSENSGAIFGGNIDVHLLFMADKSSSGFEEQLAAITKVAEKHRGSILHVHVPHTEDRVMEYFGASADALPLAVIADMTSNSAIKKYSYDGEITEDGLMEFEGKFFKGELTPSLKSEEPSEEDLEEPVKVVKGKSFSKMVIENDKDVMVEFYAPWCGHCKKLAPKYDELAKKLEGVESVVIAKMDATENEIDVDGVDVSGFPTIFFFPGKAKDSPILYKGARETDDLASFIMDKASTSFKLDEGAPPSEKEEVREEL